jgi:hypothetical protein
LLEGFFEKVSADGLQVVAEEIAQSDVLLVVEILAAFEEQPAGRRSGSVVHVHHRARSPDR